MRALLICMSFLAGLGLIPTINSCTYNISMAHTEGTATDTIDDTQSNTPTTTATLTTIPGV